VIHAAGVPGSGRLAFMKKPIEVQTVLAPKIDGLAVLVRLLRDTPLDFVVLVSSINSVLGAPGLCDYSSANAVLDAFVESGTCPAAWRQVVAMDWGPWRDVGMAARLVVPEPQRKAREAFLRSAIPPASGVDAFARVLSSRRSRVIIAPFDLSHSSEVLREQSLGGVPVDPTAMTLPPTDVGAAFASDPQERPAVSTTYQAPATETERRLAAIWSELLGIDRIGAHDDFFDLGGHSLMATRVLARIDHVLGARLSLRDVFDAPTIHLLAGKVTAASRGAAPSEAAAESDREELEF
jgi:acyl carrier protein